MGFAFIVCGKDILCCDNHESNRGLSLFLLSFLGLGLVVFPYIIPTEITIYEAAASPSSLVFMIIFIGFLIPIMLAYNIYQYVVFRGKVADVGENESY